MEAETVEVKGGKSRVIIEFFSKKAAIDALNCSAYQELNKLLWAISQILISLSLMAGNSLINVEFL